MHLGIKYKVGSELERLRAKRPRESLAGVAGGGGAAVCTGAVLKEDVAGAAVDSSEPSAKVRNHIGCSCTVIVVPCRAMCSCTMADKIVSSSSAPRMRLRSFVYRLCSVRHVGDDEMDSGEIFLTNLCDASAFILMNAFVSVSGFVCFCRTFGLTKSIT